MKAWRKSAKRLVKRVTMRCLPKWRQIGTRLCLLTSLLLAGCATPVVIVERLDATTFRTWVADMNASARKIATDTSELSRNEQLTRMFLQLSDTLADAPGEASLVWRRWRETSGNLTTLADYFLTRNLLLNYYFNTLGGELFMPLEIDRYGLTLAGTALNQVFGDDVGYIAPWVVSDPSFAIGTSYGPTPVVNRARTNALFELLEQSLGAAGYTGSRLTSAAVMQTVAANEVAHATLLDRFDFGVDSDERLRALSLDLPGLRIKTARQAHEFVSDAASLATHPAAIYGMTTSLLASLALSNTGELRVSGDEPYAPGAAFFANSVTTVLNRRGRPPLFDDALKRYQAARPETRDAIALRLASELIASLGSSGYRDLTEDYVQYAAAIVEQLVQNAPSN